MASPEQSQAAPSWSLQSPQQRTTAAARALAFARTMTTQAAGLVIVTGFLQIVLPAGSRPSDMIGRFHGGIEKADIDTKVDATVEMTRRQAEASAREQAKVQWEMEVLRQQMATLHESQTAESDQANTADWLCVIGKLANGINDPDARQVGGMMTGACGAGDALRAKQQEEYARLARQYEALVSRSGNTNQLN